MCPPVVCKQTPPKFSKLAATEINIIFSGRQPVQGVKVLPRFRDCLRHHAEEANGVIPWNPGELSHLDAAVCRRRFYGDTNLSITLPLSVKLRCDFRFKTRNAGLTPWKISVHIYQNVRPHITEGHTLITDDNGKMSHALDTEWCRKFYYLLSSGCGVDHPTPRRAEVKERVQLNLYFLLVLHGRF